MYSIFVKPNGECICYCRIQDGTEEWIQPDKKSAIESLIAAAYSLNGTRINHKQIAITYIADAQEQGTVNTYVISEADKKLLQEISSGHKKVLSYDDPLIKANLLLEEIDTIFDIREGRADVVYRA
jgi:hypothetical protein